MTDLFDEDGNKLSFRTSLAMDAVYYQSARDAIVTAKREFPVFAKARDEWHATKAVEAEILACLQQSRGKHWGFSKAACEFILPRVVVYDEEIGQESYGLAHAVRIHRSQLLFDASDFLAGTVQPEMELAYGAVLKACSLVHILATCCLEAHINVEARDHLRGALRKRFDALSLEGKWLFLPTLVGAKPLDPGGQEFQGLTRLVSVRNKLVHFKGKVAPVEHGEIPAYVEALQLTPDAAERSIESCEKLIRWWADAIGSDVPDWLADRVSFFSFQVQ